MSFDYHVHGLWVLGALLFFVGGVMAGNLQWIEGTTQASFAISVVLIFILFLVAAAFWISAAVNARHEEFSSRRGERCRCEICVHVHKKRHCEKPRYERHVMEERPSRYCESDC